ncbi:Acetyltransferase [Minicystis rosea]|nr:Acetyltransferase [Minicystis rosea]
MHILHTDRLFLRWVSTNDAAFIRALLNEPSWIQNIGDRGVRTVEEAGAWIEARLVASYRRQGFGFWAIERRADGVPMGICGLTKRDGLPDIDIGYALLPAFWGSGYAVEAASATMGYARRVLGEGRILAITSPGNARSQKVLRVIGMHHLETRALLGDDDVVDVFTSNDAPPRGDDRAQIDALATRFFALFTNRDGALPAVVALPHFFLPGAVITRVARDDLAVLDVDGFMMPRAELLSNGRLVGFSEREIDARTDVSGRIATRWIRYRKAGTLDGAPFEAEGTKTMQLVRTDRGWKIAALAWEDAPA